MWHPREPVYHFIHLQLHLQKKKSDFLKVKEIKVKVKTGPNEHLIDLVKVYNLALYKLIFILEKQWGYDLIIVSTPN